MNTSVYRALVALIGATFTVLFAVIVVPPLLQDFDVFGAFAAGFVNPYATGYSLDVISCWFLLAVWVIHEAKSEGIRHGWVALVLGVVPGVATGFACYLLMRLYQKRQPEGA